MGDKMDLCNLHGWQTFSTGKIRDLYTHHIYKDPFFLKRIKKGNLQIITLSKVRFYNFSQ